MADHDQDSRTERASEKRLREAREKGDSPRSRDFSAAVVTLAGVATLVSMRHGLGERVAAILHDGLSIRRAALYDSDALGAALVSGGSEALWLLAPIFVVALVATLAAPLATGGIHFSGKALGFKGSRLDPLAGIGRMFSMRSAIELAKALLKVAVIAIAAGVVLRNGFPALVSLSTAPLRSAASSALDLAGLAALALAAALAGIGMVDLPYQIWDWHKRQRMTREELKQEYRESEGSPEVKGKVRQMQAQIDYLKRQVEILSAKEKDTQVQNKVTQEKVEAVAKLAPPKGKKGIQIGGVTVTPGGFIEAAGIYRDKNMTSDIDTNFNNIPFANSSNYHVDENRFTARQSRLSLLATERDASVSVSVKRTRCLKPFARASIRPRRTYSPFLS